MKLIYICTPLHGKPSEEASNREYAEKACTYVIANGEAPVAPHIFVPELTNDDWETTSKAIMDKCDEIWVFGNEISDKMDAEVRYFKGAVKYIGLAR